MSSVLIFSLLAHELLTACIKMAKRFLYCDRELPIDFVKKNRPCKYFTDRPENIKRHIDEHHLGLRKKCHKCGKEMTQSSLIRHSKKSCQRAPNTTIQKPVCLIEPNVKPTESGNIIEYTVTTKVKVATLEDGTTAIVPSTTQMKIGNCDFFLTASPGPDSVDCSVAQEQINFDLINNDVLLTPLASPTDGKMHIVNLIVLKHL